MQTHIRVANGEPMGGDLGGVGKYVEGIQVESTEPTVEDPCI